MCLHISPPAVNVDMLPRRCQQGKLPPAFGEASNDHIRFANDDWLYRANNFREVAEPFDIANYYRLELDRASGHYLEGNRPSTYDKLERMWRQDCERRLPCPATLISSVAWADAMSTVRGAPEPAAMPGKAVQRLPPPDLPPGRTLPLVHTAL
jgi:Enhanced disease susceptibility 1 protein EP domain